MTAEQFYSTLKEQFQKVLEENGILDEPVDISCRALTPDEAIGTPGRMDYPILQGSETMIQAQCRGACGQAFTQAPATFSGKLSDILEMDLWGDPHRRSVFLATLNAVMASLGRCGGTVHCRTEGPKQCAQKMKAYLKQQYPSAKKIALIGYQPALLEMLTGSGYQVRVLDLNPQNIGQARFGVIVEDGREAYEEIIHGDADLLLCTGSTVCNGTIVDFTEAGKDVLFFGITIAGAAELMGLKRVCFAQELSEGA